MVEEELAKANAKMYSKEIERLQMAVKDTKENADTIIIEQQEEIERLNNELKLYKDNHEHLNNLLQQKENIINKIKELVNNYEELEKILGAGKPRFDLYKLQEILDKGDSNE